MEQRGSRHDLPDFSNELVKNLLPDYVKGNLSALCPWPDHLRFRHAWTRSLRFITTPDDACTFDYTRDWTAIKRGVWFVLSTISLLSSCSTGKAHSIVIIVDPMHVGFASNKGFVAIKLRWFRHKSNLHHVWDREIILTAAKKYYGNEMIPFREDIQTNNDDGNGKCMLHLCELGLGPQKTITT
ncbi:hypothetical protein Sjap_000093 [Stephania japonica]|uniref:Aspergillus nuclease S1 n=1 Tax=Stephania japonica TaxID=461633 RepID=A0AAP0KIZ1_9MAGN